MSDPEPNRIQFQSTVVEMSIKGSLLSPKELDMSVNKGFMTLFLVVISVTGVLLGYAMTYSNQVTTLLNVKMGYSDPDKAAYM